jgi:hypothetical protein
MLRWRWDKPVRWADIIRALLMTGVIPENSETTDREVRDLLKQKIAEGHIRQLGRGLYQLARQPTQEDRPLSERNKC